MVLKKKKKKKKTEIVFKSPRGRIYITASFNNTIATVTDQDGKVVLWGSCGSTGFRGARKSTPFAATTTVTRVVKRAKEAGLKEVEVYLKGPGPGREAAIKAIKAVGLRISLLADVTPIPHNGPRPRKKRRV